jgi:cell wall-associated NlpC family hydrolase
MLKLKQIATISVLTLVMTGCVSPNKDTVFATQTVVSKTSPIVEETPDIMEITRLHANNRKIDRMIKGLKKHVNKTWYVFSGSSPSGWDCSGLTVWTYGQIGISLEHRASKQESSGYKVSEPKPGDLVVFKYKGYNTAYHVGVYIGDGMMIHSPRKGEVTRVESVTQFGGKYSKISYVRFLDTV